MRMRILVSLLSVAVFYPFAAWGTPLNLDDYCAIKGLDKALRQSIVVIDEDQIAEERDGEKARPENNGWRRFIADLTNPSRPGLNRDFAPRERLSLFIARRDGSGLTKIFSGCLPIFSEAEIARSKEGGLLKDLEWFFGTSMEARAKKDFERVRNALLATLLAAAKTENLSRSTLSERKFTHSSLIVSLKRSSFIDLSLGIPRLFLFSDFSRFEYDGLQASASPRDHGFVGAKASKVDLSRSELIIAGTGGSKADDSIRHFLTAYFLEGQARLASVTPGASIPTLSAYPTSVRIFQGKLTYPSGAYPMRMRLATDVNGHAVNSWVSLHKDDVATTPFGGTLTCDQRTKRCNFIGDKHFAQVWKTTTDNAPVWNSTMPFGGLRELEFSIQDEQMSGRVFDSNVEIRGATGNAFPFELLLSSKGEF